MGLDAPSSSRYANYMQSMAGAAGSTEISLCLRMCFWWLIELFVEPLVSALDGEEGVLVPVEVLNARVAAVSTDRACVGAGARGA